jgi:hypothetical protein
VKHAPGDPTYGLQEERTLQKYRACAAYRLTPGAVSAVEHDLLDMENVPNVKRILDALTEISTDAKDAMPA